MNYKTFDDWWNEEGSVSGYQHDSAKMAWNAAIESTKDKIRLLEDVCDRHRDIIASLKDLVANEHQIGMCACGNYEPNFKEHTSCPDCNKPYIIVPWLNMMAYLFKIQEDQRKDIFAYRKQIDELKDKLEKTKPTWTTEPPKMDDYMLSRLNCEENYKCEPEDLKHLEKGKQ